MTRRAPAAWALLAVFAAAPAHADPSPPVRFVEDEEEPEGPRDSDRPRFAPVCLTPDDAAPGRDRIRALWAGGDAPRMALELDWKGWTIGHMGAMVPIMGDVRGHGLFVTLWPQLEVEGPVIPYALWRGRIALEVGRMLRRGPGQRFTIELSGGLMHESDHITFINPEYAHLPQPVDAVVLNDVFGRVTLRGPLSHWDVVGTFTPRVHLLTCTTAWSPCSTGTEGDVTLGGAIDAVAVSLRPRAFGLAPFVSARLEGHLPAERIGGEWRLALRTGLVHLYGEQGAWQLAVGLRLGHPLGVDRGVESWESRGLLSLAWSH